MNEFVVAGAVALVAVIAGYVILTRREIASRALRRRREEAASPPPAAIAEGERPKTQPPDPT
jgi:hypothetical protein